MKSAKDILKELGFNPNAPLQVQQAFLKHLIQAAQATTPIPVDTFETQQPMIQLEFDFSKSDTKKVS